MSLHAGQHPSTTAAPDATTGTRDWLIASAAAIVALIALYAVFFDNGSLIAATGSYLHEFAHDGRHLFGAPCH
ncbi:CbtB domain-containing protein [Streptomyces indicus]|uniref:Probable cobalt transporter subunit (CbtB) n=1 Tax=Streptomyces indicus TaxID=417292 RepID=A0A1G9DSP5_9ACTN|nr:CbtB-domain containing protein [Streptomyces indicus]SDK66927.1 Probable cobalt transporter subunit (CbtB) [Streptomyces indicus]